MREARAKAAGAGMIVFFLVLLMIALSGCAGTGVAMAGKVLGLVEQKAADRAAWSERHKELGRYVVAIYRDAAAQKRADGDLEGAILMRMEALEVHDSLRPEFLVEKVLKKKTP